MKPIIAANVHNSFDKNNQECILGSSLKIKTADGRRLLLETFFEISSIKKV